jgi:hypothetical protein
MHTDCWIGDADTHYSNNGKKIQISKCFFRVLLLLVRKKKKKIVVK